MPVRVTEQEFGSFNGRVVNKYTIAQIAGVHVSVINYGAAITGISMPDNKGVPGSVVLGYDTLEDYLQASDAYMGSICGRYANRIRNAQFNIDGVTYQLPVNNDAHCLHGGNWGFDKVYWEATVLPDEGVAFSYNSPDGDEGFPGNLTVTVTYTVSNNALVIEYTAVTDKATPVSLTSHAYFNLSGGSDADIFNHQLQLNAHQYLEACSCQLPTGRLLEVAGTDMDFTQLRTTAGRDYDHCWVLDTKKAGELLSAATLVHGASGRAVEVLTTEPGIHYYSGHSLGGSGHNRYEGLCLEAQHFPDSPNQPHFPNTILQPGDVYRQKTVYRFFNNFIKK